MSANPARLVAVLQQRFGAKTVITDADAIAPWLTDWRGRFHGAAAAILSPGLTEEVAAMVSLAADAGVPLTPQGGNTSMVGGATPPADGSALILSLRRMNRLRRIDAEGRLAVAEAGMILANLHDLVAEAGMRFPLTLGARGSCTVGGLVATNAGGTQVLRFGTMRALVAGVEAVLPDGTVHSGLAALKKDNRGYSIDQLLVGSEGTLGIVTAAALRLVPAIAGRVVAWVGLASPQAALDLLRFLEAETASVEGFEIVPADALALVIEHFPGTRPPLAAAHRWNALVEATTQGDTSALGSEIERLLGAAHERGLVEDATIAASEGRAEALWKLRDSIAEAERAAGPTLAHDVSVPVADMPRFMVETAAAVEQAFPGTTASGFGHLGDGNVHFHVRGGSSAADDWIDRDGEAISRLVHDLVTAAGGSISAEHGIGQMKLAEFKRLAPPGRIAALRAIKRGLDPRWLLNPGKLIDGDDSWKSS